MWLICGHQTDFSVTVSENQKNKALHHFYGVFLGGKGKFTTIITKMKDRKNKLLLYDEGVDNIHEISEYNIRLLDEILKYLLTISNYPMQPVKDNVNTIGGHILKIFGKGKVFLDKMYNCAHNSQNNMCKDNFVTNLL